MLELKHVTKVYRSKKGSPTTALNDISLKFGETGMVFILGKSGSGKSTLLNVLGGLDQYDSGEIIIQGKSSKDFKNQDFDSYRNTYIGFVFQEFNILEDYTVYRNVALALQLQKQAVSKEKIEKILEKLDLKGFEHRKPNELSGGQKQRVAIARALVKDPDIIMADEPTGALDSTTGEQVFSVLKEISKEKLVIVVSHDREAAMKYGDRVVEFQDGNIIHDSAPLEESSVTRPFQLIRSKLPWKESFKLGFGSLNHKKIRLAFTILLASCALGFLGFSDTMSSFELSKSHAKLIADEKVEPLLLRHYDYMDEWNSEMITFQKKDILEVSKLSDVSKTPIYTIEYQGQTIDLSSFGIRQEYGEYPYYTGLNRFEFVELEKKEDGIKQSILGDYPKTANEILISNYFADYILHYGITIENKDNMGLPVLFQPKTYQELLESKQELTLGSLKKVVITGIIEYDLSDYQSFKEKKFDKMNKEERKNSTDLSNEINFLYNKIYVKTGFVDEINQFKNNYTRRYGNYSFEVNGKDAMIQGLAYLKDEIEYFDGKEWKKTKSLENNQLLVSVQQLSQITNAPYYEEKLNEYLKKDPTHTEREFFENYVKTYSVIGEKAKIKVYNSYSYNPNKPDAILDEVEIIGVYMDEGSNYLAYTAPSLIAPYIDDTAMPNGFIIQQFDRSKLETLFKTFDYEDEYTLKSVYSSDIEGLMGAMGIVQKIAFYASLVFFVFAIFLIMNFIFTSITYRKKEIGILRAIGARNVDVLKIFIWEGIVIAAISGVLAIIGTLGVSLFLNGYIQSHMNIMIDFFLVGIRQIGLILLTVFVIVFIASLLPIRKIAKMKPMDAILNK